MTEIIHRTDRYDSARDYRSEARYEADPRAEPEQLELDARRALAAPEPEREP